MRHPLLGWLAAVCVIVLSQAAAGAVTVTSVNQGYSVGIPGVGNGGGSNTNLPLGNFTDSLVETPNSASVNQTITSYIGPNTLNTAGTALTLQLSNSTATTGTGSANADFELKFSLSFAESFTYARATANNATVKLFFVGNTRNDEILPTTSGNLGSGSYIVQLNSSQGGAGSIDLRVNAAPLPEPTALPALLIGAVVTVRRKRR